MLALARLLLDALEVGQGALARLVEQPLLEISRHVDGDDAELALVVELHGGVAVGAGRLLVGGEQAVAQRADEHAALQVLLALQLADRFDNLSAHLVTSSSIRFPRTIAA